MVRPALPRRAGSEHVGQLASCFLTERHKISGLAPRSRFFGAAGCHHLSDDGRQYSRRMFPANQVKALERLVDEVERVSGVGEYPFSLSREQDVSEHGRRETGCNRRKHGALGRIAMTNDGPTLQPALERSRIRPTFERRTFPPRRLAIAVRRHAARPVEQGKICFLLW